MANHIVTEKLCPDCRQVKPLGKFWKATHTTDGHEARCGLCSAAWRQARKPAPKYDPDMPGEEWRAAVGFEGVYEVSSLGRVRRIGAGSARIGRVRKQASFFGRTHGRQPQGSGYKAITLSVGGVRKRLQVHRMVAAAFIGPCPEGHVVNHLDSDPSNNCISNLEYTTPSGNIQHAIRAGRMRTGNDHEWSKLTETDVREIRKLYAQGGVSEQRLAARFGVTQSSVHRVITKETWKHI